MDEFDTNKDGNIDAQELEKSPGLKSALSTTDTDKNGGLSEDEIKVRIEGYRQTQLALMPMSFRLTLDGQPLDGAQLRLVPESFMTSAIKTSLGTTSSDGAVSPSVTGLEMRGTQLGIYRIEISKKDATGNELVPAKYNSATSLGQEVATGVRALESEIQLALSSQ